VIVRVRGWRIFTESGGGRAARGVKRGSGAQGNEGGFHTELTEGTEGKATDGHG